MALVRSTRFALITQPAPGATTVLYTVPSGFRVMLDSITTVKQAPGTATVTWRIRPGGVGAIAVVNQILANAPDSRVVDPHVVLNQGDVLDVVVVCLTAVELSVSGFRYELP